MPDSLEICVDHRGQSKCFPVTFRKFGYSYRITVIINNTEVIFEPDEERKFRARIDDHAKVTKEHQELIPLIANELEKQLQ